MGNTMENNEKNKFEAAEKIFLNIENSFLHSLNAANIASCYEKCKNSLNMVSCMLQLRNASAPIFYRIDALEFIIQVPTHQRLTVVLDNDEQGNYVLTKLYQKYEKKINDIIKQIIKLDDAYKDKQKEDQKIEKIEKKQRQEDKKRVYNTFSEFDQYNDNKKTDYANSIYKQMKKALLIGGMASASTPFRSKKDDENSMSSQDLKVSLQSLYKKHKQEDTEDIRYKQIGNTPLRNVYDGKDNVNKGRIYSELRIQKYLEYHGVDKAIKHKLINMLQMESNTCFIKLREQAHDHLLKLIQNIEKSTNILSSDIIGVKLILLSCACGLANEFLKLKMLDAVDNILILQTIALIEICADLQKLEQYPHSIEYYYKIMGLLNIIIIENLEYNKQQEESFFKNITNNQAGLTLVDDSGRNTLERSMKIITNNQNYTFKQLPGFSLPSVITDNYNTRGYFEWTTEQSPKNNETYAMIGRNSETIYQMEENAAKLYMENIKQQISNWVNQQQGKTLIIDITIPTLNDQKDYVLQEIINHNTMNLQGKLNILIVRSEQKQHSLGLGKFAAGSSCLITQDHDLKTRFNTEALKTRTPDQQLATFYRENVAMQVHRLLSAQSQSAQNISQQFADITDDIIVNGPFIITKTKEWFENINNIPEGYSFGFVVKNYARWGDTIRVDPGIYFKK